MPYRSKFLGLALFASAAAGCFDATPVVLPKEQTGFPVVEGGTTEDGGTFDAGFVHPECRACIDTPNDPGPGCGTEITACRAADGCNDIYECAYARGCVTKKTQNESMGCAYPCAQELGISDVFGPAIQAAIKLTQCFHMACASVCEVGDTPAQ